MIYKHLKLSISDCETMVREVAMGMTGTFSVDNNGKGLIQFSIEVPSKGTVLLNVHDTSKGLTINPQVGSLQDISEAIAKKIADCCETVATKTYSIKSIVEPLYKEFAEFINAEYSISPQSDNDVRIVTKVSSERSELTITWYKNTHTLMVQGRTTPLWDEVILWFADKMCTNPLDIIQMVFDSYEKLDKVEIKCDHNLLEDLIKGKIKDVYGNSKILRDYELKWLKTSLFLLELKIDLPEYYPCVSSAIKVVEGILRRICTNKLGWGSFDKGKFAQFEESPTLKGLVQLKGIYKSILKDPDAIVYVEKLYNFMRSKRHRYSHNDGISPAEVATKAAAVGIFEELIDLINESSKFTKVLF